MENYNANLVQAVGDGTESNPFLISDKESFLNIRTNLAAYYKLTADLDFAGETIEPIGTLSIPFRGGVDGNGHTIKNFKVNCIDPYTGLFSFAHAAKFKNIVIEKGEINSFDKENCIGVFGGYLTNCIVEDIRLLEVTVNGGSKCGAMLGYISGGSIERCSIKGNCSITGISEIGGLVGYMSDMEIKNCQVEAVGMITGTMSVGGLVGEISKGTVTCCYVTTEVKGDNKIGGLIGKLSDRLDKVKECYTIGSVTGKTCVGGLIGYADSQSEVSDSFVRGKIISEIKDKYVGGLVGYARNLTIKNCYVAGKVNEEGKGVVYAYENVSVTNCYFDNAIAENINLDQYNNGKLTAGLMRKSLYIDWNFDNIWQMIEGSTYPYLQKVKQPSKTGNDTSLLPTGVGTQGNPYLIGKEEDFKYIQYDVSAYYKLIADIDFTNKTIKPVGNARKFFSGGLDGNGHTIKNFKIDKGGSFQGLFSYTSEATFSNLIIKSVEVISSSDATGVLAGKLINSKVENIILVDIIVKGTNQCGGLVGSASNGSIVGCSVKGNISIIGNREIGGLAGNTSDTVIQDCRVEGQGMIVGKTELGGLLGRISGGIVERCCSAIEIKGDRTIGGLVGNISDKYGKIKECYATGNVMGQSYLGGLIGGAGAEISDSFSTGNVNSTEDNIYVGGLMGISSSAKITNCYSLGSVSTNGKGLVYVSSYTTIINSYFNSTLAGLTTPPTQAKTSQQMLNKSTYVGWNWANTWKISENSYPKLKNILDAVFLEPLELTSHKITQNSITISWPTIPEATGYDISYLDKIVTSVNSTIEIQNLAPNTEYEFRVRAKIDTALGVWSKILKVKTKNPPQLDGLHSVDKGVDFITVMWNQVEDVQRYEVVCNNRMMESQTNTCTITGIETGVPLLICVTAVLSEGSRVVGNPIIEKIYTQNPQTDYASEFKDKCEGQTWFLDEMEKILNLKGKSLNTISSRKDFETIYALGLADRGISGKLPIAIGELSALEYLYLGNNNLSGELPAELTALEKLKEMDLTGNKFS